MGYMSFWHPDPPKEDILKYFIELNWEYSSNICEIDNVQGKALFQLITPLPSLNSFVCPRRLWGSDIEGNI